jgi:hypothetical protein
MLSTSLQKNSRAVGRFNKLMKIASWIQDIPNKITPPPFRLLQIGSAFWQSRVLYVAARLDIASQIADKTLSVEEIAKQLVTQTEPTYRLLRMLAAMGIFEEKSPHTFANNKLSNYLREDNSENIRAMILMHNSTEMSRPWYEQLEQGIRENEIPFKLTHGEELFEYMDNHAEFDALFSSAMDSVDALSGDSFATDFDWSRFNRVIDIGGSKGSKSMTILKHHTQLRALVVDRSQVIEGAEKFCLAREDSAICSRISYQAGDLFDTIPQASSDKDIYLLSAIMHAFDDADCIKALCNLAAASAVSGACIAIMDLVMEDLKADLMSTSFDLQMLMGTRGRERTLNEWKRLFDNSNMELIEIVSLRSFGKILVVKSNSA